MQNTDQNISGEKIALHFNVSRNAVWKVIKQLQAEGYLITSKHRLGYRYVGTTNLSSEQIHLNLNSAIEVKVYDIIDSTNKLAKQLAIENNTKPIGIVANQQTNGYGRYGRNYYSPKDTGIYMSLLIPMQEQIIDSGLLTTGVAVIISQIFSELYDIDLKIKWVNDLIYKDKKIAGIMTEGITDFETGSLSYIIIGVGINLSTKNFPTKIQAKAGDLNLNDVDRNLLVANLFDGIYGLLKANVTDEMLGYYKEHSIVLNQEIQLNQHGKLVTGIVTDISNNGELVVDTIDGIKKFSSGEITKVKIINGDYHG